MSKHQAATPGSDGSITVALVEDNRVWREGLAALLNAVPGFSVVHAAARPDFAALQRTQPHVLLLDIGLKGGDSLAAVRRASSEIPTSRIVVMDLFPSDEDILDFVEAGVVGFVMKDASVEDLTKTIRAVAGGADVLPAIVTNALFSQIANYAVRGRGARAVHDVRLTARERAVLDLISEGLSNKAIAARLHVSTHTVKSHVRNIMEKLMLHSRLQLAAWAHNENEEGGSGS